MHPWLKSRRDFEKYLERNQIKYSHSIHSPAYTYDTPVLSADMNSVIFRPYWNVPRSIQRDELVPKIDKDRAYLAKNGYEVMDLQNKVVTGGGVDDPMLAQLRAGKLRIRQIPGPKNSLGLVKFLFPNEHDVYLHATTATELLKTTC